MAQIYVHPRKTFFFKAILLKITFILCAIVTSQAQAPLINSFSPASGQVGDEVVIMGSNFSNTTLVYVGSGSATDFTIVSNTEIKVRVPALASTGKIQVRNNDGIAYSSTNYTVTGAPTISSFSPASGPVGTVVTVQGSNFTGASLVYVGGGSTADFTVVSDSEIQVTVPALASSGKIKVQTNFGQVNSSTNYTVTGAPTISSFSPASGPVGTVVTVQGSNFTGASLVYVGSGTTADFTVMSDSEIQVTVPALASSGILQIRSNKGTAYSSTNYTVTGAPTISSFSPASGPVGTVVTVQGSNFTGANLVYVGSGSTTDFTVVSDTEIQVAVPALASSGAIKVRTNYGQAASSGVFTVSSAPIVSSFYPTSGNVNDVVTITGQNFSNATYVYIGSGAIGSADFLAITSNEIKVRVPSLASTGSISVLTNEGRASGSGTFTVIGAPILSSFSPATGGVGATVTVTGSNFNTTNLVYIGSGSTSTFTIISDNEIQVQVPSSASTGTIRVRTNNGQATSSGNFTVQNSPVVSNFYPNYGQTGDIVTITGQNFSGATYVYLGSGYVSSSAFLSVNDTEIKVRVPSIASTGNIKVVTNNGQVTASGTFTVTSAPIISSFLPTSGPLGTTLTIYGQNFSGATRVYVGSGFTTTAFTVVSNSEIKVTVPPSATTGTIRVQTSGGQVFSTPTYTVTNPVITLNPSFISFTDVPAGSNAIQQYEVSGLGLTNGTPVSLNVSDPTSPFTISTTSGSGFGKSISLSGVANNKLNPTTIYVKYAPTVAGTTPTETISHAQGSTSSPLTINATAIGPMPVELAFFNARAKDGNVILEWRTASEKDNSHFEVEMAVGSLEIFNKVGTVASKGGTSMTSTSYSYQLKPDNYGQTLYFRLKQVDLDNRFEYSKIVAVETASLQNHMDPFVVPNPVSSNSKLILTSESNGKAVLRLSSLTGKQLFYENVEVQKGYNEIDFPRFDRFENGLYILTTELDGKVYQVKVVKR